MWQPSTTSAALASSRVLTRNVRHALQCEHFNRRWLTPAFADEQGEAHSTTGLALSTHPTPPSMRVAAAACIAYLRLHIGLILVC